MAFNNVRLTNVFSNDKQIGYNTVSYFKPDGKPRKYAPKCRKIVPEPVSQYKRQIQIRGIPILCIYQQGVNYIPRSILLALLGHDSSTYHNLLRPFDGKTAAELEITSPNIDRKTLFIEFKVALQAIRDDLPNIPGDRSAKITRLINRHKNIIRLINLAAKLPLIQLAFPAEITALPHIDLKLATKSIDNIEQNVEVESNDESIDSSDSNDNISSDQIESAEDIRENDERVAITRKSPLIAPALVAPALVDVSEVPTASTNLNIPATVNLSLQDREKIAAESFVALCDIAAPNAAPNAAPIAAPNAPSSMAQLTRNIIELPANSALLARYSPAIRKLDRELSLERLVAKQAAYIDLQCELLILDTEIRKLREEVIGIN